MIVVVGQSQVTREVDLDAVALADRYRRHDVQEFVEDLRGGLGGALGKPLSHEVGAGRGQGTGGRKVKIQNSETGSGVRIQNSGVRSQKSTPFGGIVRDLTVAELSREDESLRNIYLLKKAQRLTLQTLPKMRSRGLYSNN